MIIWLFITGASILTAIRPCHNCKHYTASYFKEQYFIGNYHGKCIKFSTTDKMTGEFDYLFSVNARQDENLCGSAGKYYENCTTKSLVTDCWQ